MRGLGKRFIPRRISFAMSIMQKLYFLFIMKGIIKSTMKP
ncbi:unnamed protein product, partial [Vitis vinifera]